MKLKRDEIPAMFRGMAHELSNVLTYLLPTIKEIGCFHQDLLRDPGVISGTPAGPVEGMIAADVERMDRQLAMGGTRLSHFFRDLRLGSVPLSPDRYQPVDLSAMLLGMARAVLPAVVVAPDLWDGAPEVLVEADPALLEEAVARMLRAAVGWARAAQIPQPVEVSLSVLAPGPAGGPGRALLRALLPGEQEVLPSPGNLLEMLCPSESGTQRSERGPLGILVGAHLLRIHGGDLHAIREPGGVALCGELPLLGPHSQ